MSISHMFPGSARPPSPRPPGRSRSTTARWN